MMSRSFLTSLALLATSADAAAGEPPERGIASWYGGEFHGRPTASGELMDQQRLTAAHRTLPFGTVVEVTNRRNGRKVLVTITDRGPLPEDRIIDLSPVAAAQLGMKRRGLAPVEIRRARWE
jgi:rare lipoprotein A